MPRSISGSVLVVFGTRPEAIKMAPVVRALRDRQGLRVRVCVTAQHRHMLDQVLSFFDIAPDIDLDLMKPGQELAELTASILVGVRDAIRAERPDLVIVHGDTCTTLAASMATYYERRPLAHVEAGLRTRDKWQPWPEEINRRVASLLTDIHFAPTQMARDNLVAECVDPGAIHVTGNTVVDALLDAIGRIESDRALQEALRAKFARLDSNKRMVLVTGHRRENFGQGFENICHALAKLAERDDLEIVYPVHLNPNVRKPVLAMLGDRSNIHLMEPQEYVPFVYLMSRATLVLTDSGGIQEEAPSLGKPVLVMRETTERPEAIHAGTAKLVGTRTDEIVSESRRLLDDADYYQGFARRDNPYGDGRAAERIADTIVTWMDRRPSDADPR